MPAGTHVHSRSRGTAFHTPSPIPGEMVLSLHSSQLPRPQPAAILDLGLLGFLFSCGFLPVLAQSEAPASAADKGFMLHSALTDCCAAPTLSRMASQLCRAWASADFLLIIPSSFLSVIQILSFHIQRGNSPFIVCIWGWAWHSCL